MLMKAALCKLISDSSRSPGVFMLPDALLDNAMNKIIIRRAQALVLELADRHG